MKLEKFKSFQINNENEIIGGNTSDLPRDRNNVQNPFSTNGARQFPTPRTFISGLK